MILPLPSLSTCTFPKILVLLANLINIHHHITVTRCLTVIRFRVNTRTGFRYVNTSVRPSPYTAQEKRTAIVKTPQVKSYRRYPGIIGRIVKQKRHYLTIKTRCPGTTTVNLRYSSTRILHIHRRTFNYNSINYNGIRKIGTNYNNIG